jgi:long-chain acyl-CoA synthetase
MNGNGHHPPSPATPFASDVPKEPSANTGAAEVPIESSATAASPPLDVARVFEGSRLVVLGGTGFLGKIFWVMLLARYPGIGKIFLMVRSSRGGSKKPAKSSIERFWSEVATNECLRPLREQHGEGFEAFLREKIEPIDGDVGKTNCGVAAEVVADLRGTIDAVVNVAGVVDFNPPLDEALDANAFGSKNIVDLARALGDTPIFHTSTCYTAGRRKGLVLEQDPLERPFPRVDELGKDLWDPDREIADCLDLIAQANHRCNDAFRQSEFKEKALKNLLRRGEPTEGPAFESELSRVRRRFVADWLIKAGVERAEHWGWPNTYTYTKSIGEQVIARSGLPFTIARPACCESTLAFPFRGWNEGISTSVPIIFLAMQGQIRIPATDTVLDFIPSDLVCAGMILSLAELLEGRAKKVYQYGVSDVNPASSRRLGELIGLFKRKHYQRTGKGNPFVNLLKAYTEIAVVSKDHFERFGSPAIAKTARTMAAIMKRAPVLRPGAKALEDLATQEARIAQIMELFSPFMHDGVGPFSTANTRAAWARALPEDQAKLDVRAETIDWMEWMMDIHLPAVEKWVLPEMEQKLRREPKPLQAQPTLIALVDQMAERHDLAVALSRVEVDGLSRVTFRDVRDRSIAVAARLRSAGVGKGDRVVLAASNHPDWAIAYFGILRVGAVAVPVDHAIDEAAFGNVLRESGARVVLVDDAARTRLTGSFGSASSFDLAAITEVNASEPNGERFEPVALSQDDVASLIYTSGTTGHPKGVELTHANFTALIASLAPIFPLGTNDRVLSVLPLHHTFEFTCGLLLPFSRGARVVYLDELAGEKIAAALKSARATAMIGVPAVWQLLERRILSKAKARGPIAEAFLEWGGEANRWLGKNVGLDMGKLLFGEIHDALGGHLRLVVSGGAALPKETQKTFAGLGLHLAEGYGLTEAAPVLAVRPGKPGAALGQVGKAIPGVEIKIGAPDEHGVGEVLARGPNVMRGYTDLEATKAVLDDDGWLHTGDLGKLDKQGRLSIVGRRKDVIVGANGENVYPDDVEARLGKVAHVEELAVVGITGSGGGERIGLLAVPAKDDTQGRAARNEQAMRALRESIAKLPYGSQPAVVHLIDAPLPRTNTRKVRRPEVRATLERLAAATARPEKTDGATSPIRQALSAVSGKPLAAIHGGATLKDELGFDSLTLTELLVALENRYGTIDPQALSTCRTVDDVERLLEGRSAKIESRTRVIEGRTIEGRRKPAKAVDLGPFEALFKEKAKEALGRVQMGFYDAVMKPTVTGRAFIPHNRPTIVVSNHASHLDMGFVKYALGSYGEGIVGLAAQDYFFEGGGLRQAFFENLTNLVPLDRKSIRQAIRQAGDVLGRGQTVLIFPEGTRSTDGEIHEFKALVGYLALTHGVDLLPVYLGGTHRALPKGSAVPLEREIVARIGPPLPIRDLERLTAGLGPSDAAREAAKLARAAVVALRDGGVVDLAHVRTLGDLEPKAPHPLVRLFEELEGKFKPGQLANAVSFYFTLGNDALAKWTVRVDQATCEIRPGKPDGGTADCVLKTSTEIFTKIVREAYVPGPAEFMSGAVKSNDVGLLFEFQKAFQLG